jgi:hypothetical protein
LAENPGPLKSWSPTAKGAVKHAMENGGFTGKNWMFSMENRETIDFYHGEYREKVDFNHGK